MRFNVLGNVPKFADMAGVFGFSTDVLDDLSCAETAVNAIERLAEDLQVPRHLADFGITDKDIPGLAEGVMKVTRLLANNPRVVNLKDAGDIYRAAL
jgi:alcohol dehydrogenase class IV